MIHFHATEEQVRNMAALACEASTAVGMGWLHFKGGQKFDPAMFEFDRNGLSLDYVDGRMVKLHVNKFEGGIWSMRDPDFEYQSWSGTYPTAADLIMAVGARIVESHPGTQDQAGV